jgi:hypothetical protein
MSTVVWYDDLSQLLHQEKVLMFFPHADFSVEEKLNACVRFSIYFSIVILLLKGGETPVQIFLFPLIVMFASYVYYESIRKKEDQKKSKRAAKTEKEYTSTEMDVEKVDKSRSIGTERARQSRPCIRKPTADNPFMNVLISDYEDPKNLGACDVENPEIKTSMQNGFENNLYRSVGDIFGKNASDRQYYTTANTQIPNDQTGFAKWLYQ